MSESTVSLKELQIQIDWIDKFHSEREKRYDERFEADERFHIEREKRYLERFESQERAIQVADIRLQEYKESANQLRGTFISKDEHKILTDQVNALIANQGENKGRREGISSTVGFVITAIGLALAVTSFFLGHFLK